MANILPKKLQVEVEEITDQFKIDKKFLVDATNEFLKSMDAGLAAKSSSREYMPMIPSFVHRLPTGKEKGIYLAGDLGGTNFRVCSIDLLGNHTFTLKQSKFKVPADYMQNNTADALFSYLALKVKAFLEEHHKDIQDNLRMGFTFSFPVNQTALNRGTLIRWTKGFNLPDCVNKDIIEIFQSHLDILNLKVRIVALANDTVGTLLSRSYQNDPKVTNSNTIVGAIFGTGTNGAYMEDLEKIPKLNRDSLPSDAEGMVINTEWGSFDNTLNILPSTRFDTLVDKETTNQGYHLFEKRISGMFMGEILRVCLVELFEGGYLFVDLFKIRGGSLPHRLTEPWELSSEVLSYLEIDDSTDLRMSELILENHLRLPTNKEERIVIQLLTRAISNRAACLSAIPLAAILKRVKDRYKDDERDFEFGCDGSVVEFYPGFKEKILKTIALIDPLDGLNKKIHLQIAKDGSGVGAALCASTVKD